MFSSRVPARLEPNSLSRALERARSAGRTLIDLTVSNPTQVGITYPADLFQSLAKPDAASYGPEPFGLECARKAVAADYQRRGVHMAWDRIVLTASTSEAYSLLFKLLCAPSGDSVLVPAPSYPLFDHLTRLDGVSAVQYPLHYDGRWWVDFDAVDRKWDARTRAVLAVSPNNPTGSLLTSDEFARFVHRADSRDAAFILDEVFADYMLTGTAAAAVPDATAQVSDSALVFRLGGLSKSAALPQLKLGWIGVEGRGALVADALQRLELICDTYLSVSTPVQIAAADLIAGGAGTREQIIRRVRSNHAQLLEMAGDHPWVRVLQTEAGWAAVLRIPARASEEEIVLDLLNRTGVVVYPGYFFDFPREAYLVVSLLPEPDRFHEGMRRVLERLDA